MAENSKIEWCHHTYNLWWGCQEVSPGCDNCYARTLAQRLKPELKLWGDGSSRLTILHSFNSQKTVNAPLKWNRIAGELGERHRVFCSSMADVFDNYRKGALDEERDFLWTMIRKTPHLDWLLLTKRLGNVAKMLPPDLARMHNVWLGISVVNQEEADRDIPKLLATPARVRFLSCEPLLGPLDFSGRWVDHANPAIHENVLEALDWVIAGGESGPGARPSHPDWFGSLRDQCVVAGVPFLFKQWGEWAPDCICGRDSACRETPRPTPGKPGVMFRCGKKEAGRSLNYKVWDQFPELQR